MRRRTAVLVAAAAALPAACGSSDPCAVPAAAEGARELRWVAEDGSDSAAGTCAAPWATLAHAARQARPGTTVVVQPGEYGRRGETLELAASGRPGAPLAFVGRDPEERPVLRGAVDVAGSDVRLAHLRFVGPTGAVLERTEANPLGEEVLIDVRGDRVEIADSEVTGGLWHAGVYLSGADDVRLVRNHIHGNGNRDRPEQANLDHGIYFGSGSGLVAGNLVEDNVAYGVHLYPRASDVTVAYNTVVRNGRGGVIVAEQAAGNLIVGNILAYNDHLAIRSSDLSGAGNRAVRNLVWRNGGGEVGTSAEGIAFEGTIEADPRFDDDYALDDDSPAIDRGPRVDGVERDRDGDRRPRGDGMDLGADERE